MFSVNILATASPIATWRYTTGNIPHQVTFFEGSIYNITWRTILEHAQKMVSLHFNLCISSARQWERGGHNKSPWLIGQIELEKIRNRNKKGRSRMKMNKKWEKTDWRNMETKTELNWERNEADRFDMFLVGRCCRYGQELFRRSLYGDQPKMKITGV